MRSVCDIESLVQWLDPRLRGHTASLNKDLEILYSGEDQGSNGLLQPEETETLRWLSLHPRGCNACLNKDLEILYNGETRAQICS